MSPQAEFRSLMSTFPTGVAIVTTLEANDKPWGMTCSSVCSVALEPPTLLICLRQGSPTLNAMLHLATFAVNLLHDRARPTAELFASGDPERFDRICWRCEPSFGGPHLVEAAHAIADCQVSHTVPAGDHVVVFGEVFRMERLDLDEAKPLLYGLRQYAAWHSGAIVRPVVLTPGADGVRVDVRTTGR